MLLILVLVLIALNPLILVLIPLIPLNLTVLDPLSVLNLLGC